MLVPVNADYVCPKGWCSTPEKKPFMIFKGNHDNQQLILCGVPDKNSNESVAFSSCFSIINYMTGKEVMGFGEWNEYIIKKSRNILLITELESLPVGKNFEYIPYPYQEFTFSFNSKSEVQKTISYVFKPPKLSDNKVKLIFQEYEKCKKEGKADENLSSKILAVALNGDKKAKIYLENFGNDFLLDGALSEIYSTNMKIFNRYQQYITTGK
jgi:hypothetical protein